MAKLQIDVTVTGTTFSYDDEGHKPASSKKAKGGHHSMEVR
jgi:hypothetical protein